MSIEGDLFNIVLVEPEIPTNTGNIGRTCVGSRASLHLIEPLGFEINDKQLKRAGLDYWQYLNWRIHPDLATWNKLVQNPKRVFYFTTKTKRAVQDVTFEPGDWLVFGKETKGLDEELIRQNDAQTLTIPMYGSIRSYNLANAVSVASFEVLRQFRDRGIVSHV